MRVFWATKLCAKFTFAPFDDNREDERSHEVGKAAEVLYLSLITTSTRKAVCLSIGWGGLVK